MKIVNVALGERSYDIVIGKNLLEDLGRYVPSFPNQHVVVVSNSTVAAHYLNPVQAGLESIGVRVQTIIVADGESEKNWQTLYDVHTKLLEYRAERGTTLIALGGGVIGDLAGFAAATYQRGIPLVQIPTTLLAQVDSSVGGKTAVNHPLGKNMIGAFHQPRAVIIDTDTLDTLPRREFVAGLAEVIKYGLIRDRSFLRWLDASVQELLGRDPNALAHAIERSCGNKAEVVVRDEHEQGERMLLNFGHTFGHAIEAYFGYGDWLHGEAIACGMVMAATLSQQLGWLAESDKDFIVQLLRRCGLPVMAPISDMPRYMDLMTRDKKMARGRMRLVLLRGMSQVIVANDIDETQVLNAVRECIAT